MFEDVEQLIREINSIHYQFSLDYFDTGKVDKVNLKRTIDKVPINHILDYRLKLHESINDYLMRANLDKINYYYRVKTPESVLAKIKRYSLSIDKYPVNKWMNDIFGARIIIDDTLYQQLDDMLDIWEEDYQLKNWYKRDKDDYHAYHIYFKNDSNYFFPWELQIWSKDNLEENIINHHKYKRSFESVFKETQNLIYLLGEDYVPYKTNKKED